MIEWLNSAFVGGIVGGIIGFLSSYYLQNRQWKKYSEKRDLDRIYLPLYHEMRSNISCLKKGMSLQHSKWSKIRNGALDILIEPKELQNNLRRFYEGKLVEYNNSIKNVDEGMADYLKAIVDKSEETKFSRLHKELLDLATSIKKELGEKIEK